MLKSDAGNYDKLKIILGKHDKSEDELLQFMLKNKTDWSLKVFLNSEIQLNYPEYINDAIQ